MKASKEFILREIAGEFILVPTGEAATRFNGLITLNELGAFIFRCLETEQTVDTLTAAILAEYDVPEDTARADCEEFLNQLRGIGALVESAL